MIKMINARGWTMLSLIMLISIVGSFVTTNIPTFEGRFIFGCLFLLPVIACIIVLFCTGLK